jgi:hypothetical protein
MYKQFWGIPAAFATRSRVWNLRLKSVSYIYIVPYLKTSEAVVMAWCATICHCNYSVKFNYES